MHFTVVGIPCTIQQCVSYNLSYKQMFAQGLPQAPGCHRRRASCMCVFVQQIATSRSSSTRRSRSPCSRCPVGLSSPAAPSSPFRLKPGERLLLQHGRVLAWRSARCLCVLLADDLSGLVVEVDVPHAGTMKCAPRWIATAQHRPGRLAAGRRLPDKYLSDVSVVHRCGRAPFPTPHLCNTPEI